MLNFLKILIVVVRQLNSETKISLNLRNSTVDTKAKDNAEHYKAARLCSRFDSYCLYKLRAWKKLGREHRQPLVRWDTQFISIIN